MEIGIGLRTTIPGVRGHEVIEWARRADAAGFSTLGTIDRLTAATTTTSPSACQCRRSSADRLMEMLEVMKRLWAGEKRGFAGGVGPDVSDNPPKVFLGGRTDPVFKRAARVADGWMMGGGPPEIFGPAREKLEAAWRNAGREKAPYKASLTYHSLAEDPEAAARASIGLASIVL